MTPAPVIKTERLVLRMPAAADFAAYRAFYQGAEGAPRRGGGAKTERDVFAILAADIGHWTLRGFGIWAVEPRQGSGIVGTCGLYHPEGWSSHELTWWLLPDARGAGFGTEASRAAIRYGYDILGWPVVETHMRDDNGAARRLAARLGGRVVRRERFPDGVERDVWALPRPVEEGAA